MQERNNLRESIGENLFEDNEQRRKEKIEKMKDDSYAYSPGPKKDKNKNKNIKTERQK